MFVGNVWPWRSATATHTLTHTHKHTTSNLYLLYASTCLKLSQCKLSTESGIHVPGQQCHINIQFKYVLLHHCFDEILLE